jgi:hypothetical protein
MRQVFAGPAGVIYAINKNGALLWLRHKGYLSGAKSWSGPLVVGGGWAASRVIPTRPSYEAPAIATASRPAWTRGTFVGKWPCPKGFRDPRNGGECWTCPGGYSRTVFPVNGAKACSGTSGGAYGRASRGKKTAWAGDCKSPYFWDAYQWGACWKCPSGYDRVIGTHISSSKACRKRTTVAHRRASYRGKPGCPSGTFHDPRNGGECWKCPSGYDRTLAAVTSGTACKKRPSGKQQPICDIAFAQLRNLVPRSWGTARLAGTCPISVMQGFTCQTVNMVQDLITMIGQLSSYSPPLCRGIADPIGRAACGFGVGDLAGIQKLVTCWDRTIARLVKSNSRVGFNLAGMTHSVCKTAGEVAFGMMVSKYLKGRWARFRGRILTKSRSLRAKSLSQRAEELVDRMIRSKAITNGLLIRTALVSAMNVCVGTATTSNTAGDDDDDDDGDDDDDD